MSFSQSVDRALTALWILNGTKSSTVTEVAKELGVHKSTASRLLSALEHHQLVERSDDSSAYRLGQGILQLASSVANQRDFTKSAQSLCSLIARDLEITANVAVLDEIYAINIAQASGSRSFLQPRQYVGRRTPGHATSSGKVLIAAAGENTFNKLVSSGLESYTHNTITDAEDLASELAKVTKRGWASSNLEWENQMTAIAVPVFGAQGEVVAAATITGHRDQLPPEDFAGKAAELAKIVARFGPLLD